MAMPAAQLVGCLTCGVAVIPGAVLVSVMPGAVLVTVIPGAVLVTVMPGAVLVMVTVMPGEVLEECLTVMPGVVLEECLKVISGAVVVVVLLTVRSAALLVVCLTLMPGAMLLGLNLGRVVADCESEPGLPVRKLECLAILEGTAHFVLVCLQGLSHNLKRSVESPTGNLVLVVWTGELGSMNAQASPYAQYAISQVEKRSVASLVFQL